MCSAQSDICLDISLNTFYVCNNVSHILEYRVANIKTKNVNLEDASDDTEPVA